MCDGNEGPGLDVEPVSLARGASGASVARGRLLVAIVAGISLMLSVGWVAIFILRVGNERVVVQVVRAVFAIVICNGLYRGAGWARGLYVVLAALGVLLNLLNGNSIFALLERDPLLGWWLLAITTLNPAFAVFVMANPSVDRYFRKQRA